MKIKGYKVLTEDNCPPIQGGQPLFGQNAVFPLTLPKVILDTSNKMCGSGWNFCETLNEALAITKICGKSGVNRVFRVEPSEDVIKRDNKFRCSELTILETVSDIETFLTIEEPNNKQRELFEWFNLPNLTENKSLIEKELLSTLKIKKMDDWSVVFKNKTEYNNYCNNNNNYYYYNYYYYYHYRNYYNYHYCNYYNNNYYYNYMIESFFESNQEYRKSLIEAYKNGMRQIRFNSKNKQLIIFTKSELP